MHRVVPLSPPRVRVVMDRRSPTALALSFAIMVVVPTLLWSGLIYGIAQALAVQLSAGPMALIIVVLSGFLTLIWAVITTGRSPQ